MGRDHTLFALTAGQVRFTRSMVPLQHKKDEERCFVNVEQRHEVPTFVLSSQSAAAGAGA